MGQPGARDDGIDFAAGERDSLLRGILTPLLGAEVGNDVGVVDVDADDLVAALLQDPRCCRSYA